MIIFVGVIDFYEYFRNMVFMNTIERLNRHMGSRGFPAKIARLSGLSRDTVVNIAKGITRNPGFETLKTIDRALDQYESEGLYGDRRPGADPAGGENHQPEQAA